MTIAGHRSRERTPAARGWAFGAAHAAAVANTVAVYERMLGEAAGLAPGELDRHGARVAEVLAAGHPEIVEEIEGIALGAGQRPERLLAINGRTELLAAADAAECSVLGVRSDAGCLLAQTWDWHPDLRASRVCWTVEAEDGRWLTTFTEAGMVAKIGINGDGLACTLNFLSSSADAGVDGIPIHVLLRAILARCASAAEARDLLLAAPVGASSCITLADRAGELLAVELSPGGASTVEPEADGVLVHTNHFLAGPVGARDLGPELGPDTLTRLDDLRARASAPGETTPAALHAALASHAGAPRSICRHVDDADPWPDLRATLLTVVLDPATPSLHAVDGGPCAGALERVQLPSDVRAAR